jgi:hypothetical protein
VPYHGRVAALYEQDLAGLDHGDRDGRGRPVALDEPAARAVPVRLERAPAGEAESELGRAWGHVG